MTETKQLEVRAGLAGQLARLWRYGLILSGSRSFAEDLVQSTCIRALECADQFPGGSRLDRWLFSILRSNWLNGVQGQFTRQEAGIPDANSELVFDGAITMESNILAQQVLNDVRSLPQGQLETLFLVYVEGMTYQDAADLLDVPIGTVTSRLAAARERLGQLSRSSASEPTSEGKR
jgi:RNA polymerase sigma-70 factor, ECF subfamily